MKQILILALISVASLALPQPANAGVTQSQGIGFQECESVDPKITAEEIRQIAQKPFFDETSFECRSDWLKNEIEISAALRDLGEKSFLEFESKADDGIEYLALRNIVLAYTSLSVVRSLECAFDDSGSRKQAVGGIAKYHNLWASRSSDLLGTWQLDLSKSDCEFLDLKMAEHSTGDIAHRKVHGSAVLDDGAIILVHGRSLREYYNQYGDIDVTLVPGLVRPSDPVSEANEAALETVLDYFTDKASKEGKQVRKLTNQLADK